jgi:initiation factor 1A
MVKNKKGGKGHKKMSSKHAKGPPRSHKLRLPQQEGEIIAQVIKTFGHGMVDVLGNDGITRLCIIRKKFRGRNRRDNEIRLHSYILVGIRGFEIISRDKKPKSDLIYVYSDDQKTQLKQGGHINSCLLGGEASKNSGFDISTQIDNVKITEEEWEAEFTDI